MIDSYEIRLQRKLDGLLRKKTTFDEIEANKQIIQQLNIKTSKC